MNDLLQLVHTVDIPGLVQLGIHGGQRGDVDDAAPASLLPDAGNNVDGVEVLRILHEVNWRSAQLGDHDVNYAAVRVEESGDHGHKNHRGYKVRRIGNCLNQLFVFMVTNLVEHQRENDWHREASDNAVDAQHQSIGYDVPGTLGGEKLLEILQPYPVVPKDAQPGIILLERQRHAVHGQIVKQNVVHQDRYQQQI